MKSILVILVSLISMSSLAEIESEDSLKFGLQGVLIANEGKGNQLAEIMLLASKVVSKLDGCELYLVQQSIADENKILITELWSSKEHHRASLKNDEVLSLISEAKPIISAMEGTPVRFIGAHGVGE